MVLVQQLLISWVLKVTPGHRVHVVEAEVATLCGQEVVFSGPLRHNVREVQPVSESGDAPRTRD